MTEIQAPGPGEQFADEMVRYSPRQVTLEPQVAQAVRLQLRKPAELAAGEYRSHLLFRAVPSADAAAPPGLEPSSAAGVSVQLKAIYGVSIPVIVQHGDTSASLAFSDLKVRPASTPTETQVLQLRMNRAGNQSVYGNLNVTFLSGSARPQVVGLINGIAVYTPNAYRDVEIPLRPPPGLVLARGRLRVTCVKEKPAGEILAEAEIAVP